MEKFKLDTSGTSKMLELCKNGRQRKIARLYYVNDMDVESIAKHLGFKVCVVTSEILLINKHIESNIGYKNCGECGAKIFTNQKGGARVCDTCKKATAKQIKQRQYELYRAKPPKTEKSKKIKTLRQIEKERAEYNKKHNTWLSYGQYVSMFE